MAYPYWVLFHEYHKVNAREGKLHSTQDIRNYSLSLTYFILYSLCVYVCMCVHIHSHVYLHWETRMSFSIALYVILFYHILLSVWFYFIIFYLKINFVMEAGLATKWVPGILCLHLPVLWSHIFLAFHFECQGSELSPLCLCGEHFSYLTVPPHTQSRVLVLSRKMASYSLLLKTHAEYKMGNEIEC